MFKRMKGALPDPTESDDRKKDERISEGRMFDGGAPSFQPQPGGFGRRMTPVGGSAPQRAPGFTPAASGGIAQAQVRKIDQRGAATGNGSAPPLGDIPTRIADWLTRELKDQRGVHCETMLTAVGALAGYAAQQALWEGMVRPGKMAIAQAFKVVETHSGRTYFFGEALDTILASMEPRRPSIWKIVAGGTVATGGEHQLDIDDLFRHCAATAGTAQFGLPRLPHNHLPSIMPWEALERFWPGARLLLALAEPLSWPLHMANAAQKLMLAMKGSIAPDLAVKIVMEAAVPMSRVDPTTVPND